MSKLVRLCACLLCAALLSGCASRVPTNQQASVTLPPAVNNYEPPLADAPQDYAETVQLSVPALSGGQLIMVPERILLSPNQHPAEATLKKLLSFTGNERAAALFPNAQLQLQAGSVVEISGEVATVDLGANANLMSRQDFLTLSRAITNTLVQWGDIRYVNILVEGRAPAMDAGGLLPLGTMQQTRNEDAPALWDSFATRTKAEDPSSLRFSSLCTLYYPSPSGRGILAEARAISFRGQSQVQMAMGLLEALSASAQTLPQAPQVPDLVALLTAQPESVLLEDGSRLLRLQFLQIANETFIQAGIPRSVMLASLSHTLCSFLPNLQGIQVRIGNEQLEAIVPSGIYEGAGTEIVFSGGVLRRADFKSFLLTDCSLYFASGQGLVRVRRPVPHQLAFSKRYLLQQLLVGPQPHDSVQGTQKVLPDGLRDEDLVAVSKEGNTALVNFSGRVLEAAERLSPVRERQMVYAVVNTLCETRGVNRVRLFIDGTQPDSIAGAVWLPGEFLYNPDILNLSH